MNIGFAAPAKANRVARWHPAPNHNAWPLDRGEDSFVHSGRPIRTPVPRSSHTEHNRQSLRVQLCTLMTRVQWPIMECSGNFHIDGHSPASASFLVSRIRTSHLILLARVKTPSPVCIHPL